MSNDRRMLARRYAKAILNCYNLSHEQVHVCHRIGTYFTQHSACAFFLRLSSISGEDKIAVVMNTIRERFVPSQIVDYVLLQLLRLLQSTNRFTLFMQVCKMLRHEYHERHAIEPCTVYLSHDMDINEISPLISWLEQQVGMTLEPTYQVDAQLIAGIRIRGETFVWEDSIARRLRQMQHNAYAQWGIV